MITPNQYRNKGLHKDFFYQLSLLIEREFPLARIEIDHRALLYANGGTYFSANNLAKIKEECEKAGWENPTFSNSGNLILRT